MIGFSQTVQRGVLRGFMLALVLATAGVVSAQDGERSAEPPVTSVRQTGVVELLRQDAGYVHISGQRYSVDNDRTRVYVADRELRLHDLDTGMVVAFTTDGSGTLLWVQIVGPAERIRELETN